MRTFVLGAWRVPMRDASCGRSDTKALNPWARPASELAPITRTFRSRFQIEVAGWMIYPSFPGKTASAKA